MSEHVKQASYEEPLNLEQIREARRLLSIYCRKRGEMCSRYLEISSKTAEVVGSLKLFELGRAKEPAGIDAGVAGVVQKMRELYAMYISGAWISVSGDPLVKMASDLTIEEARYEKGDLVAMSPERAIVLSAIGAAVPVKSAAVEL